jgi:CBS domain-containing protein
MKIRSVMTRDAKLTNPDDTLEHAAKLMKKCDCGILPVADGDHLVGMITDRDIAVRAVAEGKGPNTRVREVMSSEVLYCFDDQETAEVAHNMADIQVRRLPVMNRDKRLIGIVSVGDLAREASAECGGEALYGIARPGGQHNQSRLAA